MKAEITPYLGDAVFVDTEASTNVPLPAETSKTSETPESDISSVAKGLGFPPVSALRRRTASGIILME